MLPWQQLCHLTINLLSNRVNHFQCFCGHGKFVLGLCMQSVPFHIHVDQIYQKKNTKTGNGFEILRFASF